MAAAAAGGGGETGTGSVGTGWDAAAGARASRAASLAAKAAAEAAKKAADDAKAAAKEAAKLIADNLSGFTNFKLAFLESSQRSLNEILKELSQKLSSGSADKFKKLLKKVNSGNSVSTAMSKYMGIPQDASTMTLGGLQVPAQNAILNFLSNVSPQLRNDLQSPYGENILDRDTTKGFKIDQRANGGGGGVLGVTPICYGLRVPVTLGVSNPTLWHSNEIEHTLPKSIFGMFTGGPPTAKFFNYLETIFRICGIGLDVNEIQPYIVLLWNALLLNSTKLFNQVKFSKPLFRVENGLMELNEEIADDIYKEMFGQKKKTGKYITPFKPSKGKQTYSQGTDAELKSIGGKLEVKKKFTKYDSMAQGDFILNVPQFKQNLSEFVESVNIIYRLPFGDKYFSLGHLLPDIGVVFEFFKWSASGKGFNKAALLRGAIPALKRLQDAFPVTQPPQVQGGGVLRRGNERRIKHIGGDFRLSKLQW